MAAALIYLATLAFVPISVGYFSFFFIKREKLLHETKIDTNVFIIALIVILSFLNKVIGYQKADGFIDYIPETALMILMYWVSKSFDNKLLKILVILTAIETIIVFVQYSMDINSFFPRFYQEFQESDLLYQSRPYGLSSNTSVIALKIFLSVLIIFRYRLFSKKIYFYGILFIFSAGIVLTFNRTVIVSILIFLLLYTYHKFKLLKKSVNISALIVIIFFIIFLLNYDVIIYQFTRGRESDAILSGRVQIWMDFINYFKNNLFLGNNSYKYFSEYFGRKAHAHSSFLQIFATHGIIISILYLILIFKNINKNNYPYVIAILAYSIAQYGIFWGFSITDIVLFTLLFNKSIDNEKLPYNYSNNFNIFL